jgi:AAA domain (dynein-related subfamily)
MKLVPNDIKQKALPVTTTAESHPAIKRTHKAAPKLRKPTAPKQNAHLDEYMVDPEILNIYQHRVIKHIGDFEMFESYHRRMDRGVLRPKHILLEGPTSSGKTMAIEAYAAEKQVPLFTISGAGGTTESDLFGRYAPVIGPDGKETLVWADGPITLAAKYGGIVYVNEGNFIPPEVSSLLYSLTDFRGKVTIRGAVKTVELDDGSIAHRELRIKAHPELWVVVDGNSGYQGTVAWNYAFKNRFETIEWGYDTNVEAKLLNSPALQEFIQALRVSHTAHDLFTPIATKQFVSFIENIYDLGWDFAVHVLLSYFDEDERALVGAMLRDGFEASICKEWDIRLVDDDPEDFSDDTEGVK